MKQKTKDILDEFSNKWSKDQMTQLIKDWQSKYTKDEQPSLQQLAEFVLDIRNLI